MHEYKERQKQTSRDGTDGTLRSNSIDLGVEPPHILRQVSGSRERNIRASPEAEAHAKIK